MLKFQKVTTVSFILQVLFFRATKAARILAVVTTPSYSHQNAFYPLWEELSLRGHQVTLITTDPINNSSLSNLTEIDVHDVAYEIFNRNMQGVFEGTSESVFNTLTKFLTSQLEVIEHELSHPKVQAIIKNKTEHFDLFMIEATVPVVFAFAERFKCPFIVLSSMDGVSKIFRRIGNPAHPVTNPDTFFPTNAVLTFKERLISVSMILIVEGLLYFYQDQNNLIVKKTFGLGYSDMNVYSEKASMMFLNSNPIFFRVRPLSPNVIQFGGGTHIKPHRPLPENLRNFLDLATEGFIYFSLGSNIKSRDLPTKIMNTLMESFSELPYKILWKFEEDKLTDLPNNVIILKWTPQQDILRHPNIKLFITQGGLQSLEEAIHIHVPIVGLPFFGDQHANIKRVVDLEMGLSADPFLLNTSSLKSIILEVINNPKYRNRVKYISGLIQDQPMTGLQRAIWWTEYVIRHKGAVHFKSPALDLPFYQYYLLDVIGFYVAVMIIFIYGIFLVMKLLYNIFLCRFVGQSNSKLKSQ